LNYKTQWRKKRNQKKFEFSELDMISKKKKI